MEMIEVVAKDINEAQTDQKEVQIEASDVFMRANHPVTLKVRKYIKNVCILMCLLFVVHNYLKLIL